MDGELVSLRAAALRLGVPGKWLAREADAGSLPHLRAGTRLLFNLDAVLPILLARAAGRSGNEARAPADAPDTEPDQARQTIG